MCGRTCLTLEPDQILHACRYNASQRQNVSTKPKKEVNKGKNDLSKRDETESVITPLWRAEFNCGRMYRPSYNIAPTDMTPVIVSNAHFDDDDASNAKYGPLLRVVVPMMWGMIPFWHKGDFRKHGLTTNNCRLENMLDSKLYRGPFRRGQRCVVLCEGFYEWQTSKSAKPSDRAVYLIHMPQDDAVKIYDKATWPENNIKMLFMAGLFDVWRDKNGDKIYSYSIITFESSKIMSWMHDRMPAIFENDTQINDWLDYKRVSDDDALATLRPASTLEWHRVTSFVNNPRNKSDKCNKPIELLAKSTKPSMNKIMLAWLNTCNNEPKKRKSETMEGDIAKESELK